MEPAILYGKLGKFIAVLTYESKSFGLLEIEKILKKIKEGEVKSRKGSNQQESNINIVQDRLEPIRLNGFSPIPVENVAAISDKFFVMHDSKYNPNSLSILRISNFKPERLRFLKMFVSKVYHQYIFQELYKFMSVS